MITSLIERLWLACFASIMVLITVTGVSAHSFNESYVYFDVTSDTLSGRVELNVKDLAKLDAKDGAIETPLSQEAILAKYDTFTDYLENRILLVLDGERLEVDFRDASTLSYLDTEQGLFAQMRFDVTGFDETPVALEMSYDAVFSDYDPSHRGYALIGSNTRNNMEENEGYISLIFSTGDGLKRLYLNDEPTFDVVMTFLEHGVWHIWLGFDHVLFLITLLISSVMFINSGRWEPTTALRDSMMNTVKIVTVFTVAHTITLSVATFNILTLPVPFVEAIIALSIAVVAIGNLFPRFHTQSWKVVFIFGLFHGFGFANVLEPLGLDTARKAIGLASFNIGVELGQLAIVFVVFPILFALRNLRSYRVVALQGGSVALIAIAIFWFVERTYGALAPAQIALLGG